MAVKVQNLSLEVLLSPLQLSVSQTLSAQVTRFVNRLLLEVLETHSLVRQAKKLLRVKILTKFLKAEAGSEV